MVSMGTSTVLLFATGLLVAFGLWCLIIMRLQHSALYRGRASVAMSIFTQVRYGEMNGPGSLWNTVHQYPAPGTQRVTNEHLLEVESVFLRGRDPDTGEFLEADRPAPTVLFCHSNASTVHGVAVTGNLAQYQRRGMHVVLVEYRGYGSTPGAPSQAAITADMMDAYDLMCRCGLVDASRIVFHGFSLGGGVIGSLARWRKPAAMILESTFSSGVAIAHAAAIPAFLMSDSYRTDHTLISYATWPVLVLHGDRDMLLPVESHGRILYDAVKVGHEAHKVAQSIRDISELKIYSRGHYMEPYSCRYWSDILVFLKGAGVLPEGVSSTPLSVDDPYVVIPHNAAGRMEASSSSSTTTSAFGNASSSTSAGPMTGTALQLVPTSSIPPLFVQ